MTYYLRSEREALPIKTKTSIMFDPVCVCRWCGSIVLILFATAATWADSLVLVTNQAGQGANDSVRWSQLGADGTTLGSSFSVTSAGGGTVTVTLSGPNSLASVACPASPCSWAGPGFTAGENLVWTSDTGNGGNGPLTLSFAKNVSGVGSLIQPDGPGQFTAQIQVFNGTTSLGSFTVASDANGDAVYIGVLDQTGANISSVVFSLTVCSGVCTDFAIGTANLDTAPAASISLTSSVNPSSFGQAVTFTATVKPAGSGTPTGTVSFNEGAAVLGTGTLNGGTATFTTSTLGGGAHSITAVYSGDANFAGSTSPALTETVSKVASSTSVVSSNNPSAVGTAVIFTATVTSATGTPTGVVTFQDGASTLGTGTLSGGKATFTASALGAGAHSVTAVYGGDANFAASTSPALVQTMRNVAASSSVISSNNNPSIVGTAVTFTAAVTSSATGTPTGAVTFQDGASTLGTGTLSGGTATFTTSALVAGAHSITAVYNGDANFAGSTSPALTETVSKVASSTSVMSSNNPSAPGTVVTFTATVTSSATGTPTGVVTFQDGASTLGTGTLSGGKATFTASALGTGAHSITATYGGDANFAGSTSSVLAQTMGDFSLSASPAAATVTVGSTSTYAITITPVGGFNQTISFQCSGAPLMTSCMTPGSVSSTGGSYASFNISVATTAPSSLMLTGTKAPWSWGGLRVALMWLLALVACATLSRLEVARRRSGWQVSIVAMFVLLLWASCGGLVGCAGATSVPKGGTATGTYTLTLTGTSGSMSHNITVTLTVK